MPNGTLRKVLLSRAVLISLALIAQMIVLAFGVFLLNEYFRLFYVVSMMISIVAVLWIINNQSNPAYKIAWIIPILLFPIFGGLFYLFFGGNRLSEKVREGMWDIEEKTKELLKNDATVVSEVRAKNDDAANQAFYIEKYSRFPLYRNECTEYFPSGEAKYERLCQELRKAERYIFLEYFIISEGVMWGSVLEILEQKTKEGVDVRLIYDDAGCMGSLPMNYHKKLEKTGIKCCVFNPVKPVLTLRHNNRDHRKIAVIDGKVAFTGGVNLADEYINLYEKYGHWKDSAILLRGEAVFSFVVMFLTLWGYLRGVTEDIDSFRPLSGKPESREGCTGSGYIQPYADSPMDGEMLGETIYFNLINKAKRYVYITTPYLIVSNEMVVALSVAAKAGVDVRIMTPYHPDKPLVHAVTRSYYKILINSGVKIYEYLPGFVHSKTFVVDDEYATVGTINMDYRSFYFHFECGVFLYAADCIAAMKDDFENTLPSCKSIGSEDFEGGRWYKALFRSVLRVFAPLM